MNKSRILDNKFKAIVNSDLSLIDKIYWLIKDVKRYGTLPFAGVARASFNAVQILKSFVYENIINDDEYNSFLNTLNTISKQLSKDINNLNKKEFIKIYGHLRPGTYDIISPRYDEFYDTYFRNKNNQNQSKKNSFKFSKTQKNKINRLIIKNKLDTNFKELIIFIKESIEGREYIKFKFTNHLSQILKYIEELGKKFDIDKKELAFLDIKKITELYSVLDHRDLKETLKTDIEKNKKFYKHTKALKLPGVIVNQKDIYNFFLEDNEPNFITLNRVKSTVVSEDYILKKIVRGKIICIKSADPGYDYLFSKNIGGLITCYGGSNSHMAIRCAELGIPAVIGCGEKAFSLYSTSTNLEIDAVNKKVTIL